MSVPVRDIKFSGWSNIPLSPKVARRPGHIATSGRAEAVLEFEPVDPPRVRQGYELNVRFAGTGRLWVRLYDNDRLISQSLTRPAKNTYQVHVMHIPPRKARRIVNYSALRVGLQQQRPGNEKKVSQVTFKVPSRRERKRPNDDVDLLKPLVDRIVEERACQPAVDYWRPKENLTIRHAVSQFRDEIGRDNNIEYGQWARWAIERLQYFPEFSNWFFEVMADVAASNIGSSEMMILKTYRAARENLSLTAQWTLYDRFNDKLPEAQTPDDYPDDDRPS